MNLPRVIPILLLKDKGVVKTRSFKKPVYIGDPVNAVRIFNEKEVDELLLLDITATLEKREPWYDWIRDIVSESFMPVAYGGGIRSLDSAKKLFDNGLEKIVLNSYASEPHLIESLASVYGSQSILACVDVKKSLLGKYSVFTYAGTKNTGITPVDYTRELVNRGVGEIIIQSIDKEGRMEGLDLDIIRQVAEAVDVPVVASGGVGSLEDISDGIKKGGASGIAAGSFCVFKGKSKGILINYPPRITLEKIFA